MKNVALVVTSNLDIDHAVSVIKPTVILKSTIVDKEKQLADLGVQLDEILFHNQTPIDIVFVMKDSSWQNIDFNALELDYEGLYFQKESHLVPTSGLGSFYCSPGVFSSLSNLYKLDFASYEFKNSDSTTAQCLVEKILFLANRLGYKIYVK